jgi:hypothetical protein
LFPKEGALLLGELGPFPKENSLFLGEVVFFTKELILLHREFVWDWHFVFFCSRKLLPKGNNVFLIFKCFMDFFIHFVCQKKQLGKGLNLEPLG